MLVLKCRVGTQVHIGSDVVVTVELIVEGDACLSVNAPDEKPVLHLAEARMSNWLTDQGGTWDLTKMKLLSSRPNMELAIGDDVHVAVLGSGNDWVKLGIAAPPDVAVSRHGIPGLTQPSTASV